MNTQSSRPLRVAIIASSLKLAGAEKQTFYMARALHRAGIEVRLYHLGGGGHYESALHQSGVTMHTIYHPDRPWRMLAGMTNALLRWRPHIVLAAQFSDLCFAIPAGRACQALVAGGVRSDGFYELNGHGRWGRWIAKLAHGLIANSWRARQNLVSQKISAEKIEVLANVIDLADFDERGAQSLGFQLPANRIITVAVGNLHACKRFDRFIEALALARRSVPALTGVVAGADCGVQAEMEARAQTLGLTPDDLVFLGRCDRVPALLANSAMLVLSSDYEGFPNVILEAMAARLPVISVPAGDAGMIVQHGKTGYVVETGDVRDMSAFMVQLAQFPDLRKCLGEAGRRVVEQKYNCESLAERLLDIFHGFASRLRKLHLCELLARDLDENKSEAFPNYSTRTRVRSLDSSAMATGKIFPSNS
jgi:glycosyltransferase involved in cell wall biosynthesis